MTFITRAIDDLWRFVSYSGKIGAEAFNNNGNTLFHLKSEI